MTSSSCNEDLRAQGAKYPRTCAACGLGPCPRRPWGRTTGTMAISVTPGEFAKIQEAQLRNGETLGDTLMRLAGLREQALPGPRRPVEVEPWLVAEADKLHRAAPVLYPSAGEG